MVDLEVLAVDKLPHEIRYNTRAVAWRFEPRGGRWTKVPYQPRRPDRRASVDDPQTWGTFDEAHAVAVAGRADGLGVVLGAGLVGVDLDHVRDVECGTIAPHALAIVRQLNSYTELSPSGSGLHVLAHGNLPPSRRRKGHVEMYAERRFFTVTGVHLAATPTTIEERTAALAVLHASIFGTQSRTERPPRRTTGLLRVDRDDARLLERAHAARNGEKFRRLWAGETSEYVSPSEADLALCNLLAFWTGGDAGRVDALFRRSGLMRAKWDASCGALSYGAQTIARAIEATAARGALRGDWS